jgi:hypothetical protein
MGSPTGEEIWIERLRILDTVIQCQRHLGDYKFVFKAEWPGGVDTKSKLN